MRGVSPWGYQMQSQVLIDGWNPSFFRHFLGESTIRIWGLLLDLLVLGNAPNVDPSLRHFTYLMGKTYVFFFWGLISIYIYRYLYLHTHTHTHTHIHIYIYTHTYTQAVICLIISPWPNRSARKRPLGPVLRSHWLSQGALESQPWGWFIVVYNDYIYIE